MLLEIRCDKFVSEGFVRSPVRFHMGLNVVLGTNKAANSIGKSTFLLIIDFVFGGDDYPKKAIDVIKNVGEHVIQFAFKFGEEIFYFSRSTSTFTSVNRCDAQYRIVDSLSVGDFTKFLAEKYGIKQEGLSLRGAISRSFRVHQRENLNAQLPLKSHYAESESEAIVSLEKIFDQYRYLAAAKSAVDEAIKECAAFAGSTKYNYVPYVSSKKEYTENQKRIDYLRAKQDANSETQVLKAKTNEELIRITRLRVLLPKLRTERTRLESRKISLQQQLQGAVPSFNRGFEQLRLFFPNANFRHLSEVESFHQNLTTILRGEIQAELEQVEKALSGKNDEIARCEGELESFDIPSNTSKKILIKYSEIEKEISRLDAQNKGYEKKEQLKENRKKLKEKYQELSTSILLEIQTRINDAMREIDGFIYDNRKKPPVLSLTSSSCRFETIDDSGTGTSYKSMIVFDLSVLKLTNSPAIIHDSLVLKNIGDAPIDKIIKLYTFYQEKQCFISFDKANSFSDETKKILEDSAVLHLSENSGALFGRSWSMKEEST